MWLEIHLIMALKEYIYLVTLKMLSSLVFRYFKMVRLTAETIENAYDFLNTCKQRELSLRGMQIPAIENLGVTRVSDLKVYHEGGCIHQRALDNILTRIFQLGLIVVV